MLNGRKISRDVYSRAMSGVSVAKKNGGQTSAIFANDTRWRPNSQILHRRDRSNSRVTETARPSGVPPHALRACYYTTFYHFRVCLPHLITIFFEIQYVLVQFGNDMIWYVQSHLMIIRGYDLLHILLHEYRVTYGHHNHKKLQVINKTSLVKITSRWSLKTWEMNDKTNHSHIYNDTCR